MKVFCAVLICLLPMLFVPHTANGAATQTANEKASANSSLATSTKEQGAAGAAATTTITAELSTSSTSKSTQEPSVPPAPQYVKSGYGVGSVFMGIIFGMVLMYSLIRLYSYWVNRKFSSDTSYRAY